MIFSIGKAVTPSGEADVWEDIRDCNGLIHIHSPINKRSGITRMMRAAFNNIWLQFNRENRLHTITPI